MSVGLSNVGIVKRPSRLTTTLAAEKAEKSETDVGSQDLSELGGSLGASGVWRLGSTLVQWHAGIGDMPGSFSRRGERSAGGQGVGGSLKAAARLVAKSDAKSQVQKWHVHVAHDDVALGEVYKRSI